MSQNSSNVSPLALRSNFLAAAAAHAGADEDGSQQEQRSWEGAEERKLSAKVASTLKAYAPLQQIIAFEQMQGMSNEDAAALCRQLIEVCQQEAQKTCVAIEIPGSTADWGKAYFSASIAEHIARAWPRRRQECLEVEWSVSLCEVATPSLDKALTSTWRDTEHVISLCATAMNAVQGVMQAYDTFNLLHKDKNKIRETMTEWLLRESDDAANAIAEQFELSETARCSLMQSLLKNGGRILASLWDAYSRKAVDIYQNKANEQQKAQLRQKGFPLEDLHHAFQEQLTGLAAVSKTVLQHNKQSRLESESSLSLAQT